MLARPDDPFVQHKAGKGPPVIRRRAIRLHADRVWKAYMGGTGSRRMNAPTRHVEIGDWRPDDGRAKVALPLTTEPFSLKRDKPKPIYRTIIPMRLRHFLKRKLVETVDIFDYARTYGTSIFKPNYIRRKWIGAIPLEGARRVVVFNHFDMQGIIHDYVVFYLEELVRAGFTIVFTSNSPRFPKESVERLNPLVAVTLWRHNVGYDFGAFKDGIAQIPAPQSLDMLLITNDSMYGPLQDFDQIIRKANPNEADLWGITDCWDGRFHLQSYFLLFHPQAIRNPAFAKFWGRLPYFKRKRWVVKHGEIGLTPFFLRNGVRCKAMFPYRELVATVTPKIEAYLAGGDGGDPIRHRYVEMIARCLRDGVPLNQTHFFWDHLLVTARCPFIKRDLLHHNPMAIPYLHHWQGLLRQVSRYDADLIVKHMQTTMRNRVY